jgi:hypothetical protein
MYQKVMTYIFIQTETLVKSFDFAHENAGLSISFDMFKAGYSYYLRGWITERGQPPLIIY